MNVFVVAQESFGTDLLQRLLVPEGPRVLEGGSPGSALSRARTLLAHEYGPVILVMNSDNPDEERLDYMRVEVEELLHMASPGVPYRLSFAVPEVEALFFADRAMLRRLTGTAVSDEEMIEARMRPRRVLEALLARGGRTTRDELPARLDVDAVRRLRETPLLREIRAWIAAHAEPVAAGAPLRRTG